MPLRDPWRSRPLPGVWSWPRQGGGPGLVFTVDEWEEVQRECANWSFTEMVRERDQPRMRKRFGPFSSMELSTEGEDGAPSYARVCKAAKTKDGT